VLNLKHRNWKNTNISNWNGRPYSRYLTTITSNNNLWTPRTTTIRCLSLPTNKQLIILRRQSKHNQQIQMRNLMLVISKIRIMIKINWQQKVIAIHLEVQTVPVIPLRMRALAVALTKTWKWVSQKLRCRLRKLQKIAKKWTKMIYRKRKRRRSRPPRRRKKNWRKRKR